VQFGPTLEEQAAADAVAFFLLWAYERNHQLGYYACGLVPGSSPIGLVQRCWTPPPTPPPLVTNTPTPTATPTPGGASMQPSEGYCPSGILTFPTQGPGVGVPADATCLVEPTGSMGGLFAFVRAVYVLTSDCAQGIGAVAGLTVVAVGSTVTGASLVEGGFPVTTTVGTTLVSGTAIAVLGGAAVTGAQNLRSCIQ
jgi:hypothetical protein